jgi:nicotinamide-nucleotide amidase
VRAEIIGIGTEILLGQICNDNAQWMSERLAEAGVDVPHHQVVGDNEARIADAFRLALSRADAVLATGGLGPTQDDITREGLAAALGLRLVRVPEIEEFLRDRFRRLSREMAPSNLRQADVPEGARYFLPERGTAPGLALEAPGGKRVYAMAGVPAEMREMMTGTVLPELAALSGSTIASRVLRVAGVAESTVADALDDVFRASANPSLAYLASEGVVKLRITAKAASRGEAETLIEPVAAEVTRRLGADVFTAGDEEIEAAAGRLLRERGQTVAAAESLTGGGVGARISRVEAASDYFLGSAVCYTAEAKQQVLGVSRATIERDGVVSEACAREMAAGARRLFGSDWGISTTGVAGPAPHDGKPVGTVWVGLAGDGVQDARSMRAPGDREQVRRRAEVAALDLLRRHLAAGRGA